LPGHSTVSLRSYPHYFRLNDIPLAYSRSIAESANLTKADAGRALDAFTSAVTTALSKGESVALVGFGTYSVKARAERKGRNPQTGKAINIPAKKVAKFKAGAELSKKVK